MTVLLSLALSFPFFLVGALLGFHFEKMLKGAKEVVEKLAPPPPDEPGSTLIDLDDPAVQARLEEQALIEALNRDDSSELPE